MKSINRRVDEFSVQYTLDGSKRFFIRFDMDNSSKNKIIFTDFMFEDVDSIYAKKIIMDFIDSFANENTLTIEVYDIAPNEFGVRAPNYEVIHRCDKISKLITSALSEVNRTNINYNLEYRLDRFDLIVSSSV